MQFRKKTLEIYNLELKVQILGLPM